MVSIYSIRQAQDLIDKYIEQDGGVHELDDGGVGLGTVILYNKIGGKLYSFVIKEVYLNEWSSGQTIRRYIKLPKKYADMVKEAGYEDIA